MHWFSCSEGRMWVGVDCGEGLCVGCEWKALGGGVDVKHFCMAQVTELRSDTASCDYLVKVSVG